jgi:hypothetical protein
MPASILRAVIETQSAAAEAKLKSFGSQLDSTAKRGSGILSKFSAVGVASFAAVGTAAIAFAGSSIKAFMESEKALTNLNTTLSNSPALAGATTEAFEKQAEALLNLTGISDEAIINADAILGRYGLTEQQLQSLIPVVLDFAVATGQDATAAAEGIGKALLGSTKALKTIGVEFKATGDRGKDVATVMGLVEGKVGGMAEAMGDTAAGKLNILNEQFDNVQETIGGALIPILSGLTDALGPVIEVFGEVSKAIEPLIKLLGEGLGKAAQLFVLQFKPITMALDFFGDHAAAISNFFIEEFINPVITGLNAMLNAIDSALGPFINFPDIPELKTLATDVHTVGANARTAAGHVGQYASVVGDVPGLTDPASDSTKTFGSYLGVVASSARDASFMVNAYLNNLANLAATPVPIFGQPSRRQHGGPVEGGVPYIVGERGPELFVPRSGGRIVPNGQGGAPSDGSNMTVNVYVQGDVNGIDEFKRKVQGVVTEAFARAMRR